MKVMTFTWTRSGYVEEERRVSGEEVKGKLHSLTLILLTWGIG